MSAGSSDNKRRRRTVHLSDLDLADMLNESTEFESPDLADSDDDQDYMPDAISSDDEDLEEIHDNVAELLSEMTVEEEEAENEGQGRNVDVGDSIVWDIFRGRQKSFPFTGKSGLQSDILPNASPYDLYKVFVDNEIIDELVKQTNLYATQALANMTLRTHSRFHKWTPTSSNEMRKFLGLAMWMGLVRLGSISDYWSNSPLYKNEIASKTMSRNRFEILLKFLHFADNTQRREGERLAKIQPLLDMLLKKFQATFSPGHDIVIDESLIPWRGRLVFRQYLPNKAHKYGIKLFKLCSSEGYTYNIKIYSGKAASGIREVGMAKNVCEELASDLKNEGRTLYVDNFYTSYDLAKSFLAQNTHLVGTVRANKKEMPEEVMKAKLKRGEMIAREDANGIVVLKWKDTRDVRLLSTKHSPVMENIREEETADEEERTGARRKKNMNKPSAILAYNKGKTGIDFSDQMASYATTLRKGVKWYRKLGMEMLLGMALVNAFVLYKIATKKKIKIRKFREEVALALLDLPPTENHPKPQCANVHTLQVKKDANGKKTRRACSVCYAKLKVQMGRMEARKKTKMVSTYCPDCKKVPFMCLACFGVQHKN